MGTNLFQNDGAHNFYHVLRVLADTRHIGQIEEANMDILAAAVLLHDIARAEQRKTGVDHALAGAR